MVGRDPSTEIAVVKVNRDDLPAARFREGSDLLVGQLAVAIGSPSGFQSTVTSGIISGLNREVPAEYTGGRQDQALVDLIQTDAPISPGNSGGALVDRDGEVVGVNVAYLPPETRAESIGFAIPSDTAISVADQLIENGRVSSPFLGDPQRGSHPGDRRAVRPLGPNRCNSRRGRTRQPRRRRRAATRRRDNRPGLHRDGELRRPARRPARLPARRYGCPDRLARWVGGEETVEVELGERPQQ